MKARRSILLGFSSLAAVLLVLAGAAWACSAAPTRDLVLDPPEGPAQSTVTVRGPVSTTGVEIRWNSLSGPIVGDGAPDATGNFVAQVKIPNVDPGIYTLVAVGRQGGEPARLPFAVTPAVGSAPAQPTAAPAWDGDGTASASLEQGPTSAGGTGAAAGLLGLGMVALASAGAAMVIRRRPVRRSLS